MTPSEMMIALQKRRLEGQPLELKNKIVARVGEQHITLRSLLSATREYCPTFWWTYPGFEPATLIVSGCAKPGGVLWPIDQVDQIFADVLQALDGVSPDGYVFTVVDDCYGWFPVNAIQPDIGDSP